MLRTAALEYTLYDKICPLCTEFYPYGSYRVFIKNCVFSKFTATHVGEQLI